MFDLDAWSYMNIKIFMTHLSDTWLLEDFIMKHFNCYKTKRAKNSSFIFLADLALENIKTSFEHEKIVDGFSGTYSIWLNRIIRVFLFDCNEKNCSRLFWITLNFSIMLN